ncbi:hypothetical protein FOA52_015593 [Chlamydomonas sp. UWO 241]|nr:hypothetical protein FOA52_015593 [Chlamydomonas sp. UWO 241]
MPLTQQSASALTHVGAILAFGSCVGMFFGAVYYAPPKPWTHYDPFFTVTHDDADGDSSSATFSSSQPYVPGHGQLPPRRVPW